MDNMWWMLGGQAGLSILGSALGGSTQRYQASAQANQQVAQANRQLSARFEMTRLQNEATQEANMLNLQNTMFNQGMIKMQDGLNKQQGIRNRLSLGIGEAVDTSTVSLNQSAVGAIGASADAVLNDVSKKYADANAELARQRQLEDFQNSSALQSAYTSYWQNMGKIDETGAGVELYNPVKVSGGGNYILGGLLNVGTSYLERNLTLGLGSKQSNIYGIELESLKGR